MYIKAAFKAAATVLLLFPASTLCQLPNGACSSPDAACEITDDNLLGANGDVSDPDECRSVCQDDINEGGPCKYFTYFGPQGFPISNTCLFFSECPILDQGSVCLSFNCTFII